jgi:hypothetical protein
MFFRFLLDLLILYCVCSYIGCVYVLWSNRQELMSRKDTNTSDKVIGYGIFLLFAPLVMASVLWKRILR